MWSVFCLSPDDFLPLAWSTQHSRFFFLCGQVQDENWLLRLSFDTLQSLPLETMTLRAFNSSSRRQREAVNSQIILSPGML